MTINIFDRAAYVIVQVNWKLENKRQSIYKIIFVDDSANTDIVVLRVHRATYIGPRTFNPATVNIGRNNEGSRCSKILLFIWQG